MDVDYLIVGQGIAGSLLSHALISTGKKVMVIDRPSAQKASLVAGAVINPLSGKNYSPSRDTDKMIPAALDCYKALETSLQTKLLYTLPLYHFPEDEDQAALFEQASRREHSGQYLRWLGNRHYEPLAQCFHARQGIGVQEPVWQVDAALLLDLWREYLVQKNAYLVATFDSEHLEAGVHGIRYKDIKAGNIIFCEGAVSANNPLFSALPFTANRGDVLLLSIPELPATGIYHRNLRLAPRQDGLFWCGSNYKWNFKNLEPDEAWEEAAQAQLRHWLKLPFTVVEHIVAARPTTAGQIPLIGLHPDMPRIAIFNGLGTRGFSSGPYWAGELCRLLQDENYTIPGYDKAWLDRQFK